MSAPRLLLSAFLLTPALAAPAYRVTVAATGVDRAGIVVAFTLPPDAPRHARVRGPAGGLPVQAGPDGTARFVVAAIKAGEAPVFTLEPAAAAADTVDCGQTAIQVKLSVRGAPLLDYWKTEEPLPNDKVDRVYLRSGHIHPVRSPAGAVVTASYPPDHLHHHGIWTPWTKTEFQGRDPDFWNMGRGTAKVEAAGIKRTWSGPVHGGFVSRQKFLDLSAPAPVTVLDETWTVTAYDVPGAARPVRVFDLELTQTCATADPLVLPRYHYGGFGYRGRDEWQGADKAYFLTSEGETDRVKGNATRVRWCHLGGYIDGALTGTAVLGHPDNFRAPQPVRIHPKEPYISFAPQQLGEFSLVPGSPYIARFRFIVLDGPPDRALLDAYWHGYALPATTALTLP